MSKVSRWHKSAFERALAEERRSEIEHARSAAEVEIHDGQEFTLVRLPDATPNRVEGAFHEPGVRFHRTPYHVSTQDTFGKVA